MPVLTPVLPLKRKLTLAPVARFVKSLKVPGWLVVVLVLLASGSGFAIGRHKPVHHYVSYFGYPMVLDTTTGKACYAAKPRPSEGGTTPGAEFSMYDDSNRPETDVPNGPSVPLCGQE
jgi:hypothetical protein